MLYLHPMKKICRTLSKLLVIVRLKATALSKIVVQRKLRKICQGLKLTFEHTDV